MFGDYVCVGDCIEWEAQGFALRAQVVFDTDSDAEGYSEENIQAWKDGEWFFCGMVVTASRHEVELGKASLWGIECNLGGNEHLNSLAKELEDEACQATRDWLKRL